MCWTGTVCILTNLVVGYYSCGDNNNDKGEEEEEQQQEENGDDKDLTPHPRHPHMFQWRI